MHDVYAPLEARRDVCPFIRLNHDYLYALFVQFVCEYAGIEVQLDRYYMMLQLERARVHLCEAQKKDWVVARGQNTNNLMTGHDGVDRYMLKVGSSGTPASMVHHQNVEMGVLGVY